LSLTLWCALGLSLRFGPVARAGISMALALVAAFAAIAIAHLGVELAFLVGSLTGTGEIPALVAVVAQVSLLATAFAIAATSTTPTSASTPRCTAVATRTCVLRRAIAALEVRRRWLDCAGSLAGRSGARCHSGIRIGGSLLLALAFALALTLCLAFCLTLRIALARLLLTLPLALRFALRFALRVALRVARRLAGVAWWLVGVAIVLTITAMFTVTVTTAFLVTTMTAFLVAVAVAAMRATIAITSTVTIATTMPGATPVTNTMAIARSVPARFVARRGRLSSPRGPGRRGGAGE
jgi:hypothetical protein